MDDEPTRHLRPHGMKGSMKTRLTTERAPVPGPSRDFVCSERAIIFSEKTGLIAGYFLLTFPID